MFQTNMFQTQSKHNDIQELNRSIVEKHLEKIVI